MKFNNSDLLNKYVREHGDTVILSFSRGKDSIGAWLRLRSEGFRVLPVYLYMIPDSRLDNETIPYYEDFFGEHIIRLPAPKLFGFIRNFVFQPPDRLQSIIDMDIPRIKFDDLFALVREQYDIPDAYVALGVRMADSVNRRGTILRSGALNEARKQFFPIYDWDVERLDSEIRAAGVRLPRDYEMFGCTLDGIYWRFIEPLKRYYPDDYERLKQWIPMIDMEILRYKFREKHNQEET